MAWIESHQALGQHPKTYRLAKALGCNLPMAVGHLQYLWWWALDYAQDGSLARYGNEVIARACLWEGEPEVLVVGLVTAGFFDQDDDGSLSIHDWADYAGRLIEKRREDAARKRRSRKPAGDQTASDGRPADVHRTSSGRPADVQRTQPNPTVPNQQDRNPPTPSPADADVRRTGGADHGVSGDGAEAPGADGDPGPGPDRQDCDVPAVVQQVRMAMAQAGQEPTEAGWQGKAVKAAGKLKPDALAELADAARWLLSLNGQADAYLMRCLGRADFARIVESYRAAAPARASPDRRSSETWADTIRRLKATGAPHDVLLQAGRRMREAVMRERGGAAGFSP